MWYQFWVFLHIVGVVGFLLAHGVSAGVSLRLRKERDLARVQALLELSSASMAAFYPSLLLLLVGGITAGFVGHWWGSKWIWVSLGLLVLVSFVMYATATTYYRRIRKVLAMRAGTESGPEDVAAVSSSSRPVVIAAIGVLALVAIVYLMVFKPF